MFIRTFSKTTAQYKHFLFITTKTNKTGAKESNEN